MLSNNYLAVRLVRLGCGEAWQPPSNGLLFLFLLEASGQHSDRKLVRQLRQGDVLVLRPSSEQNRFVAKGSGMVFRCFSLRLEQLFPLFDVSDLSLLEDVVEGLGNHKLYPSSAPQAMGCQRLLAGDPLESNLKQRAQVLAIVARILSEEFKTARTRRPGLLRAQEHMEQVFETLSERRFLNLSVPELASRFGCSRRHLTRLFHQYFGSSIAEFRMELRLIRVACLLRNPNVKITRVAQQCGVNHLGQFNTRFKRHFGVPRDCWRKQRFDPIGEVAEAPQPSQNGVGTLRHRGSLVGSLTAQRTLSS